MLVLAEGAMGGGAAAGGMGYDSSATDHDATLAVVVSGVMSYWVRLLEDSLTEVVEHGWLGGSHRRGGRASLSQWPSKRSSPQYLGGLYRAWLPWEEA